MSQQAMRLSPRDSAMTVDSICGRRELGLGPFDDALEDAKGRSTPAIADLHPYLNLAAASRSKANGRGESRVAETRRSQSRSSPSSGSERQSGLHFAPVRRPAQGGAAGGMSETRKIAAILVADVVGYSRLAGADEDRTLSRLRGLRSDLIDPAIAAHHGRVVKRTGDGSLVEFRSVVDAVRCAIEVQNGLVERNAGLPPERRIEFRVGIHLGDVVEEPDGDLMGDGVNIAARLEGIAKPGAICLSEDAYRQVKGRLDLTVNDLGPTELKNIAEPIRVYSLEVGKPSQGEAD